MSDHTEVSTAKQRRAERKAKKATPREAEKPDKKPDKTDKAADKKAVKAAKADNKVEKSATKADTKLAKQAEKAARKLEPKPPREHIRPLFQLRLLTRTAHPFQALAMGLVIGIIAAIDDRGFGGSFMAGFGVFLTQLALGLLNDAFGEAADARSGRARKPIAAGVLPRGNATFLAIVLVMLSVPVAALNGTAAGAALMLTLPVGFLHNRVLHRTPASFIGWMVTFALLATYLAYGGWGGGVHGDAPTWQFLVCAAALGLVFHFVMALPDLATDHKAGLNELPLMIARRTGAAVLLAVTVIVLIAVVAVTLWCALQFGIRQR